MKLYRLIVLDDGETYSSVDGASMIVIDDKTMTALEEGTVRICDINPIAEILFKDYSRDSIIQAEILFKDLSRDSIIQAEENRD